MFLFIAEVKKMAKEYYNSNTSHVLIYPLPYTFQILVIIIQIHLMFLFIAESKLKEMENSKFKYISCSYLSYSLPISYYYVNNPNTSHVLIYLRIFSILVSFVPIQIHLMFLFICFRMAQLRKQLVYSNTSHVLIYLKQVPAL